MKGLRYFTPININGEYCTGSCVLQLNPSKVITDEKGGKQDKKKKKKRDQDRQRKSSVTEKMERTTESRLEENKNKRHSGVTG